MQEYTVIIMENLIEIVKRLEICKGWDWDPISNSELDVEVEIYDPRSISTLQKQGAMDVLGMVTAQSVASYMLPAAKDIVMPSTFPELSPTPEAENQATQTEVSITPAVYRILTRAIQNLLEPAVREVIGTSQVAYVSDGRQMRDNTLLLSELMHMINEGHGIDK